MLQVKTPQEFLDIVNERFEPVLPREDVALEQALGRILYKDIIAKEYVPGFDRSSVDGYAVLAEDTFGCGTAMPALLQLHGQVLMGSSAPCDISPGQCQYVPTGGALPKGADAVVMLEYCEDYGDGTIGVLKAAAPGNNIVYRGDDVYPGKKVIAAGKKLAAHDIGALAALGIITVPVRRQLRVGIISTGDELVPPNQDPGPGQVRNINSLLLCAEMSQQGALARDYGIIRDDEKQLAKALEAAVAENDLVLISGGSSVGVKDATERVITASGELLVHGLAVKPGKPTLLGIVEGKPVVGLPGHPGAAFFITRQFVRILADRLSGRKRREYLIPAVLDEKVGANHGRAQYTTVSLEQRDDGIHAVPRRAKSSQISDLAAADGCFCIPRDQEGAMAGETVWVSLYDAGDN